MHRRTTKNPFAWAPSHPKFLTQIKRDRANYSSEAEYNDQPSKFAEKLKAAIAWPMS